MRMGRSVLLLAAPLLLLACSAEDNADTTVPAPTAEPQAVEIVEAPAATPEAGPTLALDPAVLESRDCRAVVEGYLTALVRGEFVFAARFWNDAAVNAEKLAANFAAHPLLQISIVGLGVEGAAGSLYCTADVVIGDAENPSGPGATGDIVLRRVNDVDGASAQQLRWTIRSSSLGPELGSVLGD